MITRDRVYYLGAVISLISLCCRHSALSTTMLIVGFIMVLVGYVK